MPIKIAYKVTHCFYIDYGGRGSKQEMRIQLVMSGLIRSSQQFNNFTPISNSQLLKMRPEDLQAYSQNISAMIALEQSSITGKQLSYSTFSDRINVSQSTFNGLTYEIAANTSILQMNNMQIANLTKQDSNLREKIVAYQSSIDAQRDIMRASDSAISSLKLQESMIDSTLFGSELVFASTAKYYSSLYMTYMAKENAYQTHLQRINATSNILINAIQSEKDAQGILRASTMARRDLDSVLTALYTENNALQSSLIQYKADETLATRYYTSTNVAYTAISSIYAASLLNQNYYQSLSTQVTYMNSLAAAQSAASTATTAAAAAPSDTTLSAAVVMAKQLVTTLTNENAAATAATAKVQVLIPASQKAAYAAILNQYQNAVQLETNTVSTFDSYKTAAISSLTYYSSIYDRTIAAAPSSLALVTLYSTLYESSILGSNTAMELVKQTTSSIALKEDGIRGISFNISSLNTDYSALNSTYTGYMTISTVMKQQMDQALGGIASYSSFYTSTSAAILAISADIQTLNTNLNGTTAVLYSQSSMLMYENINLQAYTANLQESIAIQEKAMYQYRESYARQKLLSAQSYYDGLVAQANEMAATATAQAVAALGSAEFVVPIAPNLTTPAIIVASNNLAAMKGFTKRFRTLYENYDTQLENIAALETAISMQRAALDDITQTQNDYLIMATPATEASLSSAKTAYNAAAQDTEDIQSNIAFTQQEIDTAKLIFQGEYQGIFKPDEIAGFESTIGSFLV